MRNDRGFSLLEVMAAFSLLIILFIPLVHAAIDGLRSEGESRRTLEASLLADNTLAEIESGLALGLVPDVGTQELLEGEFRILTAVSSFNPPRASAEDTAAAPSGISIFPASGSPDVSPLRKIEVSVSWPGYGETALEGDRSGSQNRVVRTTFAFDIGAIQDRLLALAPQPGDTTQ